ncbi:FAD-dependent oxidoreductase [Falsiroseomonas oryzae]|uniref:FAD-dependent oxidoreductase n=1 Tax=Falsiroseomonas oryzae TaxID=2766473 RepID=UPI0022EB26A5|nr:FAD-dependent oxidoreductase [Roseomonas sp. MO-31]
MDKEDPMAGNRESNWPFLGPRSERPRVIVVGAGLAGMAAAHRLLERGHDVCLIEANAFLGGKLGTHDARQESYANDLARDFGARACDGGPGPGCTREDCCASRRGTDPHEHCYHMYLTWYRNFWDIMDEVWPGQDGQARRLDERVPFTPMPNIFVLRPGPDQTPLRTVNIGSPWTALTNMFSGLGQPHDGVLFFQGMADLIGTPSETGGAMDRMSVDAFIANEAFSTKTSRALDTMTLVEAFAAASYLSSARSYQSLMKYGARLPEPAMWLAARPTEEAIFTPWLLHLVRLCGRFSIAWPEPDATTMPAPFMAADRLAADLSKRATPEDTPDAATGPEFRLMPLTSLVAISRVPGEACFALSLATTDASPTILPPNQPARLTDSGLPRRFDGQVILAVPPPALAALAYDQNGKAHPDSPPLAELDQSLADTARLKTAAMMSLDLYFRHPLKQRLPRGITILLGSNFHLTLLDNTQIWETLRDDGPATPPVLNVVASDVDGLMPIARVPGGTQRIVEMILQEMQRYISFDAEQDILHCRTHLQTNVGAQLFVNEVGSWQWRPRTLTAVPDLFLAGDFCRTPIDVVTIEAAVTSGLYAAEAVRRRTGRGHPVGIRLPDTYPVAMMQANAAALRPASAVAAAIAAADTAIKSTYSTLFPPRKR